MKAHLPPLLLLASACATEVYSPDKGKEEAMADIAQCRDEANRRHYWDRLAALKFANECLEAKGYSRGPAGAPAREGIKAGAAGQKREPGQPCEIPCNR